MPASLLTEETALAIRRHARAGLTQRAIAKTMHINYKTVGRWFRRLEITPATLSERTAQSWKSGPARQKYLAARLARGKKTADLVESIRQLADAMLPCKHIAIRLELSQRTVRAWAKEHNIILPCRSVANSLRHGRALQSVEVPVWAQQSGIDYARVGMLRGEEVAASMARRNLASRVAA